MQREHKVNVKMSELCHKYGIRSATVYNRKSNYGGTPDRGRH